MKLKLSLILVFILYPVLLFSQDESLTISTYYPSPYGSYRELRANRVAVGDSYINNTQYCWEGSCTSNIDDEVALVVEGNVGIGTISPTEKLDVNGKIWMGVETEKTDRRNIVATKGYVDDISTPPGILCGSSSSFFLPFAYCQGYNPFWDCPSGYTSALVGYEVTGQDSWGGWVATGRIPIYSCVKD